MRNLEYQNEPNVVNVLWKAIRGKMNSKDECELV